MQELKLRSSFSPLTLLLVGSLLWLWCAIEPLTVAQARTEHEQLVDQAIQAFNKGDFRETLRILNAAPRSEFEGDLWRKLMLYRGFAFSRLGYEAEARQAFAELLRRHPDFSLSRYEYPPDLFALFEDVRTAAVAATPTPPGPTSVEPRVAAGDEPPPGKKWYRRWWVWTFGAILLGAGIALSAGETSESSATATPTPTQTPTPDPHPQQGSYSGTVFFEVVSDDCGDIRFDLESGQVNDGKIDIYCQHTGEEWSTCDDIRGSIISAVYFDGQVSENYFEYSTHRDDPPEGDISVTGTYSGGVWSGDWSFQDLRTPAPCAGRGHWSAAASALDVPPAPVLSPPEPLPAPRPTPRPARSSAIGPRPGRGPDRAIKR